MSPRKPSAPSRESSASPQGFDPFGLDPRLVAAVADLGFESPTAVQEGAIPLLLEGRDVIGRARTGSGKTAAFGLPLLHQVIEGEGVRALVLCPTRELALQVGEALRDLAAHLDDVDVAIVYGGAPYAPQFRALKRGAAVVVGTPGRVIDHLERGSLDLSGLTFFALDEADEMLRMGFIDDVERLLEATPKGRQVALFSATMPSAIQRVARRHLDNPKELQVESGDHTVHHIEQRWLRVPERNKLDALVRVLRGIARGSTLVFARTRATCAETAEALVKRGVPSEALHGDLNQAARERVVAGLRSERLRVVVATDVAARGIDIDHITHVINLDLPSDVESYVHRIGRTGRAGRKGTAISFVTPRGVRRIERLAKTLGVPIEPLPVPSDADLARLEREELLEQLWEVQRDADLTEARALVAEAWAAGPDTVEELAVAALYLLAEAQHISLEPVPHEGLPAWARAPTSNKDRKKGPPSKKGKGKPSKLGPARGDGFDETRETQLFIPMGKSRGLRPGDLVGWLTNQADVPADRIGRITVLEHVCFVGVSHEVAKHVVEAVPTAQIRGHDVPVEIARPSDDRQPPQGGFKKDGGFKKGGGYKKDRGSKKGGFKKGGGYKKDRGSKTGGFKKDGFKKDKGSRKGKPPKD